MQITYSYTQSVYPKNDPTNTHDPANPPPYAMPSADSTSNRVISFTCGDMRFMVEPGATSVTKDVPAALLRDGSVIGSGIVVLGTGDTPNQDYKFLRGSQEYTYHVRRAVTGGMIELEMSAGARVGDLAKMVMYKGATTVADIGAGNWTERLVRPFTINATDLATRDSSWPTSGSPPSVNTTKKIIVDNGGDGYAHI